jgi:hypothetical protein
LSLLLLPFASVHMFPLALCSQIHPVYMPQCERPVLHPYKMRQNYSCLYLNVYVS